MNIYSSLIGMMTLRHTSQQFKDGIKLSNENTFFRGMAIEMNAQIASGYNELNCLKSKSHVHAYCII